MARRAVAVLLIAAGLGLCGFAARHYWRGWRAQQEGLRTLEAASRRAVPPPSGPGVTASAAPGPSPGGDSPSPSSGAALELASNRLPDETDPPPAKGALPPGYPYGQPIARLKIPAAKIDVVVFGGADEGVLEKGPGHIPGTELPGQHTSWNNCVISGHRDSHFRHLGWVRKGAEISLEAPSGKSRYRVISREIVTPDTVRVMQATSSPRLTLITCYPFNYIGPAPKRLVVVAE